MGNTWVVCCHSSATVALVFEVEIENRSAREQRKGDPFVVADDQADECNDRDNAYDHANDRVVAPDHVRALFWAGEAGDQGAADAGLSSSPRVMPKATRAGYLNELTK